MSSIELNRENFSHFSDEFRSKVACENEIIQLTCSPYWRITIYSASYGRTEYESVQCAQPQGVLEESKNFICFIYQNFICCVALYLSGTYRRIWKLYRKFSHCSVQWISILKVPDARNKYFFQSKLRIFFTISMLLKSLTICFTKNITNLLWLSLYVRAHSRNSGIYYPVEPELLIWWLIWHEKTKMWDLGVCKYWK